MSKLTETDWKLVAEEGFAMRKELEKRSRAMAPINIEVEIRKLRNDLTILTETVNQLIKRIDTFI
jgi:hypothetical protein